MEIFILISMKNPIKEMHKKNEFKMKPIPVFPFYPYDNKKEN